MMETVFVKIGDRVRFVTDGWDYIVATPAPNKVNLINLTTGKRWGDLKDEDTIEIPLVKLTGERYRAEFIKL